MYVNILLFHVVRDILSFIVYRMSNTKIGLQNPSAIWNLLDFGFVDASDSTISTKESSPLSIDESLNDEAINNKQIMDGDMKRKLFQRKETCSMYWKTPAKIPLKPSKPSIIIFYVILIQILLIEIDNSWFSETD